MSERPSPQHDLDADHRRRAWLRPRLQVEPIVHNTAMAAASTTSDGVLTNLHTADYTGS